MRNIQTRVAAFHQGLQQSGWTIGRNVRIDYRWGAGDTDRNLRYAEELIALAPDVVLGFGASIVAALRRASRTVPIVTASGLALLHRELIITLAAQHKLPTVYYERFVIE